MDVAAAPAVHRHTQPRRSCHLPLLPELFDELRLRGPDVEVHLNEERTVLVLCWFAVLVISPKHSVTFRKFIAVNYRMKFVDMKFSIALYTLYCTLTPHQKGTQVKFWLPARIPAAYEPPWCRLSENKKIKKIYGGVYF